MNGYPEKFFDITKFTHAPIDIHSHFNHGSEFDCPETVAHLRGLDFLSSVYKNAYVYGVGFSSFPAVMEHCECIIEENEYLHKLAKKEDWIYQWVVIDPRRKETYKQAEEMLHYHKVLGIKIHPSYHGYDVLDYGDELFEFASEHKTVILMHPQHKEEMPALADKYPDMKLIIAHLGSKEHVDAVANARHGNIYTDTSGGASNLNNILEYAVKRVGSEKILFGTDTYAFPFQFGRIALSDLSLEDKENILWKNAMRLFDKAFKA